MQDVSDIFRQMSFLTISPVSSSKAIIPSSLCRWRYPSTRSVIQMTKTHLRKLSHRRKSGRVYSVVATRPQDETGCAMRNGRKSTKADTLLTQCLTPCIVWMSYRNHGISQWQYLSRKKGDKSDILVLMDLNNHIRVRKAISEAKSMNWTRYDNIKTTWNRLGGPIPEVLQYRASPWQRWSKPLLLRHFPKISLIFWYGNAGRFRY